MDYPVGICNNMCSDEEIFRRKKDRLLHVLEISPAVPDSNRIVKEFSRSAAGRKTQNVKNLRTPDALLQTIDYLLNDVITRENVPWNVVYEFISDRLRAVRQDMVIQNLSRSICISLLQPMIKFYVYSAYRLCEEPIAVFDPHINNTHLQECLKRLLCIYDEMDVLVLKVNRNKPDLKYNNSLYSECRPFMESLYLILNMGNTIAMNRTLMLPDFWKTSLVKKCFKLSLDCWQKNYIRVCRDIYTLPPLLLACAFLHLPYIRKSSYTIMSVAYSCKNMSFPLKTLKEILLYNSEEEVRYDCIYYGIQVTDSKIIFCKSTFDGQKTQSNFQISKIIMNCLQVLDSMDKADTILSDELDSFEANPKILSVLNYIRQNIATYQEKRGIPQSQEFNFLSMLHTIGENLYNVIIVMATMFANLLPIVDIFFLMIRFAIEKLIEIVESKGNDKIIKALIFFMELIALTFVIIFICGFVLAPLVSMIVMFSNKFYAFLFG